MKASKPLKDLPGFDDMMVRAHEANEQRIASGFMGYSLDLIGEISIPALKRISSWSFIEQLAIGVQGQLDCQLYEDRHRIRLVPPPAPVAANDCEAP
jgi:hypothetical protein